MKPRFSNQRNQALTLVEVLVIIVILAVLVVLLLPALAAARKKAQRITCDGQLKEIGLSPKIWEGDHTNLYPMSVSTNYGGTLEYFECGEMFRYFQVMSNILATPKMVVCPADTRQPAQDFGPTFGNTNVSYFVGVDADESKPQMPLAGDRNIVGGTKLASGILEITTNQLASWSSEMHDGVGNVAIADGSVQQLTTSGLQQLLQQTGLATNRLAIP
jgi:competence protein ComGC